MIVCRVADETAAAATAAPVAQTVPVAGVAPAAAVVAVKVAENAAQSCAAVVVVASFTIIFKIYLCAI